MIDRRWRRGRAAFKRRVLWPLGKPLVRSRLWNLVLAGYAVGMSKLGSGSATDASPLALRWINPNRPIYDALPKSPEWPPVGCVVGGDWDLIDARFEQRPVPRAIRQHYQQGRAWTETPLPEHVREQVDQFGDAWGYVADAVPHRCHAIETLYESMQREGYLTQAALAAQSKGSNAQPPPVPVLGEITVDIGRHGQLCWRGNGQHRLAIARLLDIEQVPVLVARRHTAWQELRTQIQTEGINNITPPTEGSLRDHPDLRDLL